MAGRALKIDLKTAAVDPRLIGSSQSDSIVDASVDESSIRVRAYERWQARGCPIGSDQEDWLNAEAELRYHHE
jgi:hypothetical protein